MLCANSDILPATYTASLPQFHCYMSLYSSAMAMLRELNLRDREATMLKREAKLARRHVEQLIREAALQDREDLNRGGRVVTPHSRAEW